METTQEIKWLFDFAQTDLEKISKGDKAKLIIEAGEVLFPNDFEKDLFQNRPENKKWLDQLPRSGSLKFWELVVQLQEVVRTAFRNIIEVNQQAIHKTFDLFGGTYVLHNFNGETRFDYVPVFLNVPIYTHLKVYMLFHNLPQHSLSYCPECSRMFFNPTKKTRKYCSTKCLYRVHSRKRREADPEAYRASQREIMRKKYEADRKKKLGSKVKVHQRNRKEG